MNTENQPPQYEDEIDLVALLATLYKRKYIVIAAMVLTGLLAVFFSFSKNTVEYKIGLHKGQLMTQSEKTGLYQKVGAIENAGIQNIFYNDALRSRLSAALKGYDVSVKVSEKGTHYVIKTKSGIGKNTVSFNINKDKNPALITLSGSINENLMQKFSEVFAKAIIEKSQQNIDRYRENVTLLENELKLAKSNTTGASKGGSGIFVISEKINILKSVEPQPAYVVSTESVEINNLKKYILVSLFAGLFLGIFIAFIYDFITNPQVKKRFKQALDE